MLIAEAKTVEEAVELAEQHKREGTYDWFRGQTKDWPVKPSFTRLDENSKQAALEKINRFGNWLQATRGLEYLASQVDDAIAVAQHYGLPTNFVDFTTEPRIAGFFASEDQHSPNELACIICLNTDDLKAFWRHVPDRYAPPEFLASPVRDLWRLEAQHGRFLYCPYDQFEFFYDFDRIVFPNTKQISGVSRDEIYPLRKSQLEILLDQYFMHERMVEGERAFDRSKVKTYFIEAPKGGCDPEVFPEGLPEHESWSASTLGPWLDSPGESFFESRTALQYEVFVDITKDPRAIATGVQSQLLKDLMSIGGVRRKLIIWRITLSDNSAFSPDFSSKMTVGLARLWDGLRALPHSDDDLCAGLGMCIALGVAVRGQLSGTHQAWKLASEACLDEPIELEFGAIDDSYARAYASKSKLLAALRTDIDHFMAPKFGQELKDNMDSMLLMSWEPRRTFDFSKLASIFATEIAPCQVLTRTGAVFYSPARLVTLGLP